jgi:hypothetical protein
MKEKCWLKTAVNTEYVSRSLVPYTQTLALNMVALRTIIVNIFKQVSYNIEILYSWDCRIEDNLFMGP